ncbi:MAG TPA: DUF86 domain-containing protein [Burkholderiaceae bacterium]|nr:DUF86 domain-containing protein [Burkholderiaceae bacterium]
MRDAAASALRFAEGRQRSDLDHDDMLLFALVRAVEIVGEAAAKVSIEGRAGLPEIRWAAIVGIRNRLDLWKPSLSIEIFQRGLPSSSPMNRRSRWADCWRLGVGPRQLVHDFTVGCAGLSSRLRNSP